MPLDLPLSSLPPVILRAVPRADHVLTPDALGFVAELQGRFGMRLNALMVGRTRRQARIDRGELPDYLSDTKDIRQGIWEAGPIPQALIDRRVEIVGPVERGAMVAALNSGANVFVADFEEATAPSFANVIAGHANLLDSRDGTLGCDDGSALLMIRPRALHRREANVLIAGQPVSAALFDFGLSVVHCGRALAADGRGPFYSLPKLESHDEARFWNDVFLFAQDKVGLEAGTIKATVMIETLSAAFEMDEIVWQLRDHIAGLSLSDRGGAFSYVKTLRNHGAYILPERVHLVSDSAFLATCAARMVKVSHRRSIHAIGTMLEADGASAEAYRRVLMGFDGTQVADPANVAPARQSFDVAMPEVNQIRKQRQEWRIEPAMLLKPHDGPRTEAGLRADLSVAVACLAGWISGQGRVAVGDITTADLIRAQFWQWIRHGGAITLTDGGERPLTAAWLGQLVQEEIVAILSRVGVTGFHRGHYASATRILLEAATAEVMPDFITAPAYDVLNALD